MQNNQSSNTVETLRSVNLGSSISNNMMAYRLALCMEQHPQALLPTTSANERDNLVHQMRTTLALSKNAQNTEEYRQSLKNKYYEQYLQKLGINKQAQVTTPAQDNSTRVENLIKQKKKTFLQEIFESKQRPLNSQSTNTNIDRAPGNENKAIPPLQDETTKENLIGAIMRTVVTMGQDTAEEGRIYEGMAYKLQLWMREGAQLLSVKRKTGHPHTAFTAYKNNDARGFKITENNLSQAESQRLIKFDQQQHKSQPPETPDHQVDPADGGPSLD